MGEEVGGVVEGLHAVHERQVDAGQVGAQRAGAGADVQQVEADREGAAVLVVAHLDLAGVEVDADDLVAQADVDAQVVAELLGLAGDEPLDPARRPRRRPGTGCRRPSSWCS